MPDLYPRIEPHASGTLDVGGGNQIYWEECGNPDGLPAVVLHGGPGSGCTPDHRRFFDPERYRIVLFDQRNCGRSTPHASEPGVDLSANTTAHLIADIEALRAHRGIDRWLVFGGSWGTTLGLACAQAHPDRVRALVLFAVTTTRRSEIDWLYRGAGAHFPEAWARFSVGGGSADDLVAAYARLVNDPETSEKAARDWCDWEDAVVAIGPNHKPHPRWADPRFRLAFARIVTHYFSHGAWLEEGALIRDAGKLVGIPGVLIHGARDLSTPLITAQQLHAAWPGSELIVVGDAGHETRTPTMRESIVAALDRFATAAPP
jgi:proline iminopeptidase